MYISDTDSDTSAWMCHDTWYLTLSWYTHLWYSSILL